MKKALGTFWLLLICAVMMQMACGPEASLNVTDAPQQSTPLASKITFTEALERLGALEKSISASDTVESLTLIDGLTKSFDASFPLEIPAPFSLHSLHDLLMKNTRAIKTKDEQKLTTAWQALLAALDKKIVFHNKLKFPVDTSILKSVLGGAEPTLITQLRNDFTAFTEAEQKERNSISLESFWQPAFLYDSASGFTAEQDTGAVVITHDGNMVGILEFKNGLATPKPIDLNSITDLINVIPKTPGYVSSIGRRAAYARFDLGKTLFAKFFDYARANKINESYLHVREDNSSAINLYKSLGYTVVAKVPQYYQSAPPIGAYVMRKTF